MNKIINKFLLNGDKFMSRLHLRQPGFTYSACEPFAKPRERIQKVREVRNLKQLYRNELDKTCFAHDAAYSDCKDLAKSTISGTVLKEKSYEIARNPTYDGYQKALPSMVYKCLIKSGSGACVNEEIAEELNKPIIKN